MAVATAFLSWALVLPACHPPPDRPADPHQRAWQRWLALPTIPSARYLQLSSSQLPGTSYAGIDPGNKDFNNFVAVCGDSPRLWLSDSGDDTRCEPGIEGHVLAAVDDGPGLLSRIWLTTTIPTLPPGVADEELAIYADDLTRPLYRTRLADWKQGWANDPFSPPLAGWWSGALVSYVPVPFQQRLRVVLLEPSPFKIYYYQVGLQTAAGMAASSGPDPELLRSIFTPDTRNPPEAVSLVDTEIVLRPDSATAVLEHRGRGTVTALRLTVPGATRERLRAITLRLVVDDRATIDLPLAALFGAWQRMAPLSTLPLEVAETEGGVRLGLYLPMPFARRLRLELAPSGDAAAGPIGVQVDAVPTLPAGDWGHLHTVLNQTPSPAPAGSRYLLAALQGRGKYVGSMVYLSGRADEGSPIAGPLNVLEGDEIVTIDGRQAILGTGTEDYFNAGFYFSDGSFNHPLAAMHHVAQDFAASTGEVSAVRWHLLADAMPFERSLRFELEYGPDKPELSGGYASVAFYYLAP